MTSRPETLGLITRTLRRGSEIGNEIDNEIGNNTGPSAVADLPRRQPHRTSGSDTEFGRDDSGTNPSTPQVAGSHALFGAAHCGHAHGTLTWAPTHGAGHEH